MSRDVRWQVLVVLYLAGILSANAMAAKLITVAGVALTCGALAIPIVYLTTDLLNELYGPAATRRVVWMGLGANAVLVAMLLLGGAFEASPFGAPQTAYVAMFQVTPRIVLASSVAYLLSSLLDVWLFNAIRRRTGERWFWLRKNGSTAVSQLADTAIFVALAFAWTLPAGLLLDMVAGQYVIKIAAAPLGTPLSYLVLRFARRAA